MIHHVWELRYGCPWTVTVLLVTDQHNLHAGNYKIYLSLSLNFITLDYYFGMIKQEFYQVHVQNQLKSTGWY